MRFTSVAPNSEDVVVIPDGYEQGVVIGWGDPVLQDAPKFDVRNQTAAAQRGQFGFNNDFAALMPIPIDSGGQPHRFLLVTNHEYASPQFMFPGYHADAPTREQYEIEIAALGLSVVEVERAPGGGLQPVMGRYNRRITADTPFTLIGPGAGTDFVKTAADPTGRAVTGTFVNCAGGVTPWGTVLSGEENFQEYFGAAEGAPEPNPVDGPVRPLRNPARAVRAQVGDLRPPLRRHQDPQRAQPVRIHRRGQPVGSQLDPGQAHRHGPVPARGRQHLRHRRRHRGRLQRRRRTLRLHVQVRLQQEDAAR